MISSDSIRELAAISGGFRTACVLKGAFSDQFLSASDIAKIFRTVSADESRLSCLRAYTETAQRPDLQQKLFREPPETEDLETWGRSRFGGTRFGIVLDRPPLENDAFEARLSEVLTGIYDTAGTAFGAAEPHIFIGDYGYSPFGAHHDQEVGRILHFHLGPGVKQMYIWDEEAYVAATGGTMACFDPGAILDKATRFDIGPGDIMVLPTEGFHVGYTPDFSIGFALCLMDADEGETLRHAADQALAHALEDMETGSELKASAHDGNGLQVTVDISRALWIEDARAASNLSLVPPPPPREALPPEDAKLVRLGRFPIIYRERDDEAVLAGRGHSLELPPAPALADLAARLNADEEMTLAEIEMLLTADFSEDAAEYLATQLWTWHAVAPVA
ncbi:hypothetical protein [uncultured Roseibium sp.]|uniref:hypothetical protein n=1 Tax=uncultured Roseibium sp. TaxID=1936171 RepID=UPI003216AEE4